MGISGQYIVCLGTSSQAKMQMLSRGGEAPRDGGGGWPVKLVQTVQDSDQCIYILKIL